MTVIDTPITMVVRRVALGMAVIVVEVDRMVMAMRVDPLVELRIAMQQAAGSALLVLFGSRPRVEVEVVL